MTEDAIRPIVDQSSCSIDGIRYEFRLQWIAVQQHGDPVLARHLLRLEAVATGHTDEAPTTLRVFACVARLTELPSLLEDALRLRVATPRQ